MNLKLRHPCNESLSRNQTGVWGLIWSSKVQAHIFAERVKIATSEMNYHSFNPSSISEVSLFLPKSWARASLPNPYQTPKIHKWFTFCSCLSWGIHSAIAFVYFSSFMTVVSNPRSHLQLLMIITKLKLKILFLLMTPSLGVWGGNIKWPWQKWQYSFDLKT